MLVNLILSAILIGVIFQGIARPQSRACTILCSEKAIIRRLGAIENTMKELLKSLIMKDFEVKQSLSRSISSGFE